MGSHLCLIRNDGNGYQSKSCRIEHKEHHHRVGGSIFFRVQLLKFFYGFQSEGRRRIIESEHICRKIHKHRTKSGMSGGNIGKNLREKRRSNPSQELYDPASLAYLHYPQPNSKHARKTQRYFETRLGIGKHCVHHGIEAIAIA